MVSRFENLFEHKANPALGGGPIEWTSRSPDLPFFDLSLCGRVKNVLFLKEIKYSTNMKKRIHQKIAGFSSGTFTKVRKKELWSQMCFKGK